MRTLLVISLLAFAVPACSKAREPAAETAPAIASVTADELDAMLASGACRAVDANGEATRKNMGTIPGAILLRDYESTTGLPADKSTGLVFYCANPACSASHAAAETAIAAGYKNVKVFPDGIAGWVKAGKRTASL